MQDLQFTPLASLDDVSALRVARMASLTALPELFVELSVQRSTVYAVGGENPAGYVTTRNGTLTELFLTPEHQTHADAVLEAAASALDLTHAWAATFDPVAMAACTAAPRAYEVLGLSFRALRPADLPRPAPFPSERLATEDDVARLHEANHPDVFDDPDDIALWVKNRWVTLFETQDHLVGFGLCTPTGPETRACDIGIRVCESYQRRGFGAWIVQRMVARAMSLGLTPTAGCAADNTVSRRTLENAGFIADHRLLQFALYYGPDRA